MLLDMVHTDVCGPMEVPFMGVSMYFVSFIDYYSNWVFIYSIKRKSYATSCYLRYDRAT